MSQMMPLPLRTINRHMVMINRLAAHPMRYRHRRAPKVRRCRPRHSVLAARATTSRLPREPVVAMRTIDRLQRRIVWEPGRQRQVEVGL